MKSAQATISGTIIWRGEAKGIKATAEALEAKTPRI
jgi:hypothetical protein